MQVPQSAAEALDNDMYESEVLDYKAMLPPKEMVKKIAAMANAHGGLIILGVEETDGTAKPKKPVRGVSDPDNEERNLARQIKDQLDPNPTEIRRVEYQGKTLIEIHVAKQVCVRWDRDTPLFDVRVGSGTESMKRREIEKALKLAGGAKVSCSITPVSLTTGDGGISVNLRITVTNETNTPQTVTSLTLQIGAGPNDQALSALHLFKDTPTGWMSEPGSILPFEVPPKETVIRSITAKGNAVPPKLDHISLGGSLKIGVEKVKIPQVFANILNPVQQENGTVGHNLAEIDEPLARASVVGETIVTPSPAPLLVPELHPQRVDQDKAGIVLQSACVYLRNSGQVSAQEVRVQIQHNGEQVLAYQPQKPWKDLTGSTGRLNPRDLETDQSIHAGERLATFRLDFKAGSPDVVSFEVRIWCLNQPPTHWRLEIPRARLGLFEAIPFVQVD